MLQPFTFTYLGTIRRELIISSSSVVFFLLQPVGGLRLTWRSLHKNMWVA